MHILISGGLGFLGRSAERKLRDSGHLVRLMDRRDPGPNDTDFVLGNVLDSAACTAACKGVDVVVHAAAIHDAAHVTLDPQAAMNVNLEGTINLFRSAQEAGARRFVFLSSAKVYGDPDHLPSAETSALQPKEHYAQSKVESERYLRMNVDGSGMELVIIRPFSVYGPGQSLSTGYVGMVLGSMLDNRSVEIPGLANFRRDFVHVDDVTWLAVSAMLADSLPAVTIINAGSGVSVSLGQLVALASKIAGYELPIDFRVPGPETLTRTHACLNRGVELFGYRPKHILRKGLVGTFEWFQSADYQSRKQRNA